VSEADVVVAGAGHNSLIAAAYLTRAGLEVVVLEARDVIGGNTVTEDLTLPGFHHDSCSSAHVIIQSNPLMRHNELELDRYGLRYVYPDPAAVMPFEDGDSLTMWRDVDATVEEIARLSERDARAYRRFLDEWAALRRIHALVSDRPPGEPLPDSREARAYREVSARSAWDVVHERFEHPGVRAFLLWMGGMTIQPVTRPGTGILPLSVTAGRQEFGWATPLGGSGALPHALAALVKDHGGTVLADSPVERILIEGGRAVGVATADGRTYRARRAVLSSIHVAQLPDALGPNQLPQPFVERVRAWQPGLTLFAVHLALGEMPRYRLRQGPVASVAGGLASPEGMRRHLEAFDQGRPYPDDPWLLIVCSSVADPARAPDGQATLKLLTVAPYELAAGPGRWEQEREPFAEALVDRVAKFMDVGLDVLASVAESPVDLERRNRHNHRGSCHGGDLGAEQSGVNRPVPGWSSYRLPVEGLYQTGATTHPGGSVSGRAGRNAARVLLSDLGIDPAEVMRT
jgi:phytoene dehydrogenase-like protein